MRVCYFGTYRAEYARNQVMIAALREAGVEVLECHETLWQGIEDRVQAASGGWIKPAFWGRVLRAYWRLLQQYCQVPDYDILVVGYPGQFDVFLARLLSWLRGKPLVWDILMSIYLVAIERQIDRQSKLTVSALRLVERLACRLPDLLILDIPEYVRWFEQTHGISPERFRMVPVGADDHIFQPGPTIPKEDNLIRVIYYGSFIFTHGVPYIVEAAHLLRGEANIQFELVGDGPEKQLAQTEAQRYRLNNLQFSGRLSTPDLIKHISQADICLGTFGTTPQALITVQNKVYEGVAMAKPVVTGDSPAIRQAFVHGQNIYLCDRASPQSLAEAIRVLAADPNLMQRLAENGYAIFQERFSIARIGAQFRQHLEDVLNNRL